MRIAGVVDVDEDVITALQKRWLPDDEWSTNAADMANRPQGLEPSGSEESHDLELALAPPPPGSPSTYSSVWSNDGPWPVGQPPSPHNDMPQTLEMYLAQQGAHPPSRPGSLPPAQDTPPVYIDLTNASPLPSPGPEDPLPNVMTNPWETLVNWHYPSPPLHDSSTPSPIW